MKLVYLVFIFSLILSFSCKKKDSSPVTTSASNSPTATQSTTVPVSTDFNQFKNRFLTLASTKGSSPVITNLTISYSTVHTTADGVLGVCTRTTTSRDVTINKAYWDAWATNGKKEEMEQLLFHELGHCTLNRAHFDDLSNGIAQSIMNSYHVNKTYYLANYNYYIDELFNPTLAGTIALNTSGTSGFDGSVYASKENIAFYTMTVSNLYSEQAQDSTDTQLGIDDFKCDEE